MKNGRVIIMGHIHSAETRKKIGIAQIGRISSMKGRHHSDEAKRKMRDAKLGKPNNSSTKFKKGNIPWITGRKASEETRKKLSLTHMGHKGHKKGIGRHASEETKQKMSAARSGSKHYNWKGGKSFEIYGMDWTETLKRSIRERDNYICQICSLYGNDVHHIDYTKEHCNPANLITLCRSCHLKTNHNREYWKEKFIALMHLRG